MRFRNSALDPSAAVEEWGYDNVLTAVDRGGLGDWRRLIAAVRRAPYGAVARQLEVATQMAAPEAPAAAAALAEKLASIRAAHQEELQRTAGRRIRAARSRSGLTQAELAERAGISQPLLSSYERGRIQPTLPVLMRLEEAAG